MTNFVKRFFCLRKKFLKIDVEATLVRCALSEILEG